MENYAETGCLQELLDRPIADKHPVSGIFGHCRQFRLTLASK
ncbi:hypothetical protein [Microcoleus sp.]